VMFQSATVRGRFALAEVRPVPGGAQLTWHATVESEDSGRPVLVAEWLTRILSG
jgi:acyl dehydratase